MLPGALNPPSPFSARPAAANPGMTAGGAACATPAGTWWRRLLAAPEFPDSPARARRARLFNLCYLFCTGWLALTMMGNFAGRQIDDRISLLLFIALVIGVVPYLWVRRGRLESGAAMWLVYALCVATLGLALLGTIRAPALGFYLILVICAGLVFGGRAMGLTVVAASAAVAGLIHAENAGWLPAPDYRVTVTQWVTATAFFACVGALTLAATREIGRALARAEREVAERRRAEEELRAANRRLEEALASVKTLKGLLPICAWCRKVREDAGYWSALESYVATHTDTTFTHGICPDCQQRHFGGLACRRVE